MVWDRQPILYFCSRVRRTHVQAWRVGTRVAEPHVKAGIVGRKGVAAGHAIAHPAHGRVQDSVHEKHHIARACTHKCAAVRQSDAVAHSAHRRVQNAVYDEHNFACTCIYSIKL